MSEHNFNIRRLGILAIGLFGVAMSSEIFLSSSPKGTDHKTVENNHVVIQVERNRQPASIVNKSIKYKPLKSSVSYTSQPETVIPDAPIEEEQESQKLVSEETAPDHTQGRGPIYKPTKVSGSSLRNQITRDDQKKVMGAHPPLKNDDQGLVLENPDTTDDSSDYSSRTNENYKVTSFEIKNGELIINGSHLDEIESISINGNSISANLIKVSGTTSRVVALGLSGLQLAFGKVYNLVISDAHGSSTYPIDLELEDGSVTLSKLAELTPAEAGYVIKWNGTNWVAAPDGGGGGGSGILSLNRGSGIVPGVALGDGDTISVDVGFDADQIPQFDSAKKLNFNNGNTIELNDTSNFSFTDGTETFTWKLESGDLILRDKTNTSLMKVTGNEVHFENLGDFTVNGANVCLSNGTNCPTVGVTSISASNGLTSSGSPAVTIGVDTDNTSIEIAAGKVAIKDGGVTATKLSSMGASTGHVLKWNGTSWAPAVDDNSGIGTESDPTVAAFAKSANAPAVCAADQKLTILGPLFDAFTCEDIVIDVTGLTGVIENALNNGENAKAPSQNAVYDALTDGTTHLNVNSVRLTAPNSNTVGFNPPALPGGNFMWTLPATLGTNGQVLTTDNFGNLSWSTPTAGTLTAVNGGGPVTASTSTGVVTLGLNYDNSTIGLNGSNQIYVLDSAITNTKVAAGAAIAWTKIDKAGAVASDIGAVPTSRTVTPGIGLLGGGDLSSDRTIAVDVGTGALQIPQLDALGRLPAVDASQLTNIPGTSQWTTVAGGIHYSSGNVGIGTSIPSHSLEVSQTSATPGFAVIRTGYTSGTLSVSNNGTHDVFGIGSDASKFRITINQSNGNVGIGTESPLKKFVIQDETNFDIRLINNNNNVNQLNNTEIAKIDFNPRFNGSAQSEVSRISSYYRGDGTSRNGDLRFWTSYNSSSSERMRIEPNGNIGMGTTTPTSPLDVVSTSTLNSGTAYGEKILPTVNQSGSAGYTGLLVNVTETATGSGTKKLLDLQVDGVSKFFVDSTGAVTSNVGTSGTTANFTSPSANQFTVGYDSTNKTIVNVSNAGMTTFTAAGTTPGFNFTGGNVGIGVTAPAYPLEVNGTAKMTKLRFLGNASSWVTDENEPYIYSASNTFESEANMFGALLLQSRSNANRPIVFGTGATPTERMRVTGDGMVGIGIRNPASIFQVNYSSPVVTLSNSAGVNQSNSGTIYFSEDSNNGLKLHYDGTSGVDAFNITDRSSGVDSPRMTVLRTGNVGIGTTVPARTLEVSTASDTRVNIRTSTEVVNEQAGLQFLTGSGANASGNTIAFIQSVITQANPSPLMGDLKFLTNSGDDISEKMRITGGGNVGIGTITPSSKLQVNGPAPANEPLVNFQNTSSTTSTSNALLVRGGGNSSSTGYSFQAQDQDGNTDLFVRGDGNIGVGTTTPATRLDIAGLLRIGDDSGSCSASTIGAIRRPAGFQHLEKCDGTNWKHFGHETLFPAASVVLMQTCIGGWNSLGSSGGGPSSVTCGGSACQYCQGPATPSMLPANAIVLMESCPGSWTNLGSVAGSPSAAGYKNLTLTSCQVPSAPTAIPVNAKILMDTCPAGWNEVGITASGSPLAAACPSGMCRVCQPSVEASHARMLLGKSGGTYNSGENIVLNSGDGGTTFGHAGGIVIKAGIPYDGSGGDISISASNGASTTGIARFGGNIILSAGNSVNGGTAGKITMAGGSDGTSVAPIVMQELGGNVGIGNSVPAYKLDVTGDINSTGCVRAGGSTLGGTCTSDQRLKNDVQSFNLGLAALMGIQPRYFKYNGLAGQQASKVPELGVIAQEVEKTAPQLILTREVKMRPGDKTTTKIKQVNYSSFIYVIINAVKELYNKVLGIDQKVVEQGRIITSIQAENEKLKQENTAIKAYLCSKDPKASICIKKAP